MDNKALITTEFLGATLWGLRGNTPSKARVGMKSLVEGMGLDWSSQLAKLREHPVLAPTMGLIPMVGEDGKVREAVTLPLGKVPFWLSGIQPGRIPNPAVRQRVIEFQMKVCDHLEEAFFGSAESKPLDAWTLQAFLSLPLDEREHRRKLVDMAKDVGGHRCGLGMLERVICPVAELGVGRPRQATLFEDDAAIVIDGLTPYKGGTH